LQVAHAMNVTKEGIYNRVSVFRLW